MSDMRYLSDVCSWHASNNDRRNFTLAVGGNQCMDEGSNGIMQTWQCYQNNPNQGK